MTTVWSFPTRIVFGEGSISELPGEVQRLGGQAAFVVTDRGVQDAGLIAPITESLIEAGASCEVFADISSNPLERELVAATEAFKKLGGDVIIAVGGGSPIDVAKLVRVLAGHAPPIAQYDDAVGGDAKITNPMPPMIAVPTTAGTGSEVGRSGVVTVEATNRKTVVFAPGLMPDAAILDPALTATLPAGVTAATGFDALTHCIEAYCAKGDHPMADSIAIKGIALVMRSLEKAVLDGSNLKARGTMLKAAMMGAVAFQKGLGACHSLSHPLSSEAGLHHGLANAICLPAVLDFNRSTVQGRIADIARVMEVRGDDEQTLAFECAGAVRALRRKVGLPDGLGAAGVSEERFGRLAKLAMEDACHQVNPRECTEDDMLALYSASV